MDYTEDFEKVLLKQSIKHSMDISEDLKGVIQKTTKTATLEKFLNYHDFAGQILLKEDMLAHFEKDDPEIAELIEKNIESIKSLKGEAEKRLAQLKGKDEKDKDSEEAEYDETRTGEEKSDDEEKPEEEKDALDRAAATAEEVHNNRESSGVSVDSPSLSPFERREYLLQCIKYETRRGTDLLNQIKSNVIEHADNSIMVGLNVGFKPVIDRDIALFTKIKSEPYVDPELQMLCEERIKVATELKQEIDKQVEALKQKQEKDKENTDDLENSKKELEAEEDERDSQEKGEGEKPELEPEAEEKEDSDENPRKAWELTPDEKTEVQQGQVKTGKEYSERGTEPPEEENVVEQADVGIDR